MVFVGVAAYGLDDSWLGRRLDYDALEDLKKAKKKYGIDVGGEGGEYETFVSDGPIYRKRLGIVKEQEAVGWRTAGELVIEGAVSGQRRAEGIPVFFCF